MKNCFRCGNTKPITEFYRHSKMSDGHLNKCKECTREDVRVNRENNAEYYREYDRNRFQNDPRVRERHNRYRKTSAYKRIAEKSRKKWVSKNPEKIAAHIILRNRVRSGDVVKPDKCEVCGKIGRVEGHHEDYSLPLDVQWLCRRCHVAVHKKNDNAQ